MKSMSAQMIHFQHKVPIYKEYHSVCPIVGIGTLPPPLSPASVPSPRNQRGGGRGTFPCGWGIGGVTIPTTGEKISTLPTLCFSDENLFLALKAYVSTRNDGFSTEMVPNQRPYFLVSTRIRPQL